MIMILISVLALVAAVIVAILSYKQDVKINRCIIRHTVNKERLIHKDTISIDSNGNYTITNYNKGSI